MRRQTLDDPTLMRDWNAYNDAHPIRRGPEEVAGAEARIAALDAKQAAYAARCRAEAQARPEPMIVVGICAYCGEPSRQCQCWD
jgi:hypothetical protein